MLGYIIDTLMIYRISSKIPFLVVATTFFVVATTFFVVATSAPKFFQSHDTKIGVATFFAESQHNVFNVTTFSRSHDIMFSMLRHLWKIMIILIRSRDIASTMSQHLAKSFKNFPKSRHLS